MKYQLAAGVVCVLLIGCAVDRGSSTPHKQNVATEAPEATPETYALGSTLTPSGAVPKDASSEAFGRGGEVFLSVDVASASTDQTIEVEWLDDSGHVMHKERRNVPVGTRYTAFASGRDITARAGERHAVIVINGRRVTEKTFRIL